MGASRVRPGSPWRMGSRGLLGPAGWLAGRAVPAGGYLLGTGRFLSVELPLALCALHGCPALISSL